MYSIPDTPEDIRREMLEYHRRKAKLQTTFCRTKKDYAAEQARSSAHLDMVDFWENVQFRKDD